MTDNIHHRGIAIKLDRLDDRRWRWKISPPKCVLGLQEQYDEVSGDEGDAVKAARPAIEVQSSPARPQ